MELDSRLGQLECLQFDNPKLVRLLQSIKCELHFVRYRIEKNASFMGELGAELAALVAQQVVPDLVGTWTDVAIANEVDYDDFWLKKIWNVSADGRSKSSNSMTGFRFALYEPPYGGASEDQIVEIESALFKLLFGTDAPEDCYRIFAVDTRGSSYFINEWWDYLWVAAHRERPELIVIYGSSTD